MISTEKRGEIKNQKDKKEKLKASRSAHLGK